MPYDPLPYEASYLQPQESAGCGRHALNNLLGGTYFIKSDGPAYTLDEIIAAGRNLSIESPIDLQRVCKYLASKSKYDNAITCPDSENYLADVLSFALRAAGYDVHILYRHKDGKLPKIEGGDTGYIFNYNYSHWVALRKLPGGNLMYTNSITESSDPKITTTQSALFKTDEEAFEAGIKASLATSFVEPTDKSGTRTTIANMPIYLAKYNKVIQAVLVIKKRSAAIAENLRAEESTVNATATAPETSPVTPVAVAAPVAPATPATVPATVPEAPETSPAIPATVPEAPVTVPETSPAIPVTSPVTVPVVPVTPEAPAAPRKSIYMVNLFTSKIVPSAIATLKFNGPETLKKTDSLAHEIEFLNKLGLIKESNNSVIIDPAASVLYADDGVFSEVLPSDETWNITKIWNFLSGNVKAPVLTGNCTKAALKKYLFLMRDIVLPRRIATLSGLAELSTETEAGRQIQTELNEMKVYLTQLKEIT